MALPDPRKRILQQRAKEAKAVEREMKKSQSEEHASYYSPSCPAPENVKFHTPLSYKGCNVYSISKDTILISNSDKRFLSIIKSGDGCNVYRFPDHTKVDNPLTRIDCQYENLDENQIRSIINHALS